MYLRDKFKRVNLRANFFETLINKTIKIKLDIDVFFYGLSRT